MKKIRVKPIFGNHQIYQEIVNHPPKGVEYLGIKESTRKGKYYESKKLKERFGRFLQKLNLPRMILIKPGKFDLVHSSRGIIPLTKKPWVMDVEHVHSFFGLNPRLIQKRLLRKFIEKKLAADNCKAILCHCEATRKAFFHYLNCEKFKEKIKVLYPSSHEFSLKKEKHKPVRILSIMSDFYGKAGPQILKVFSMIEKAYPNAEFWIRADIPKKMKERANLKNVKYMKYFGDIIPREKLLQTVYSPCDILFYPTLTDSFGYSLIDGMIAKLPIVGTNLFAVPEIVLNGKTGLIVKIPGYNLKDGYVQSFPFEKLKGNNEKKFIKECFTALSKLIENKTLREKMGRKGFERISKGDLSIPMRNKNLLKFYDEALK
jgi:glycosyltransferase involved in cell wall biosynthesis